MAFLKVNGVDISSLASGLKVGYETLVSDNSGRNAAGNTVIDVINKKIKLYVNIRHTIQDEMKMFLDAINSYVVTVEFLDPKTKQLKTITAYTGTPEPEYYTIQNGFVVYKPINLNFIEL